MVLPDVAMDGDRCPPRLPPLRVLLVAAGFGLWMVKPVGDSRLVAAGYLLVLLGSLMRSIRPVLWIDRRVFGWSLASLAVGLMGALIGYAHANPGLRPELVFFLALPALWLVIAFGLDARAVRAIVNLMPISGLAIGGLGFCYWLDATGRARLPWVFWFDLGQGVGRESYGYVLRFYPISTLVFLLPFLVASLLVANAYSWDVSRRLAMPATAAALCLAFVSGRRVLFVAPVLALAIGLALFARRPLGRRTKRRAFGALAALVLLAGALTAFTGFSPAGLVRSVLAETSPAESVRAQSGSDLLASWWRSPLWGHGLGAVPAGIPRSEDRPWNFELQYRLILNATGLVGVAVLSLAALGILRSAARDAADRREAFAYMIPIVIGTLSLLIANATNPYMHTAGHYWMFFLLVVGANAVRWSLWEEARANERRARAPTVVAVLVAGRERAGRHLTPLL